MKKRILCVIFTFLILIFAIPFTAFAVDVEPNAAYGEKIESTSIEYDFERYLPSFDLSEYKEDKSKNKPELIAMYDDGDYLYLYVYNPARLRFYERGTNCVNLSAEADSALFNNHTKCELIRKKVYDANVFTKAETDALVIKYQVKNPVSSNASQFAFQVSELELQLKNGVVSYPIGTRFIFTLSEDGTKNVTTYSTKVVEIDDLGHTYYRVQAKDVDYHQDIRCVYFAVDKELIKKNLEFNSVRISWEECKLKPMLLVDDDDVRKTFDLIAGKEPPANFRYSFGTDIRPGLIMANFLSVGHQGTDFDLAFNPSKLPIRFYQGTNFYWSTVAESFIWAEKFHNTFLDYDNLFDGRVYNRELDKIYFTFLCEKMDGYVPGEQIMFKADVYDGIYDGNYSDDLFVENGKSGKLEATFDIEQTEEVGKYKVKSTRFQYLLNGYKYKTKTDGAVDFETFERFYPGHLKLTDERLAEAYLINDNDVDEFREFCAANEDKEIYFLRYSVTDTKIVEASVFGGEMLSTGNPVLDYIMPDAECYVCNASLMDTVLISDLDVIQLGFGDVKDVYTAYGVASEPTDHIPDAEQFKPGGVAPESDDKNYFADLIAIAGVLIAIILIAALTVVTIVIVRLIRKRGSKKNEKKNN